MRLSKWVLAVIFSLSLVAVATWVTLAQDDGEPTLTAGDATSDGTTSSSDGARGAADGNPRIAAGDVEPGNDLDTLGMLRGIRGERGTTATIDLDPLGDLLDFGLVDVTSDVEVRSDVLVVDAVLRDIDLLGDFGNDEVLRVERAAATVDVTRNAILDDVLDDFDDLRLLDDRNANDPVDRVQLDKLNAGAVIEDLTVFELGEPRTASTMDDVLANLDLRDVGNLDSLVAHDELGRPGVFDQLDRGNLNELDRMEGVDVLGRLDGRALPDDPDLRDLNVHAELDAARSDPLADLELLELFDLGNLGLRDGLGLGPP